MDGYEPHDQPDMEETPMFDEDGKIVKIEPDTEVENGKLMELATKKMIQFVNLEKKRKKLEAEDKEIANELSLLNEELLKIMKTLGMPRFTAQGRTVYIKKDVYASALQRDDEDNNEAARERLANALVHAGYGSLVKRTVNASSLASLAREFDPEKVRTLEVIYENMPEELRGVIKVSIVEKVASRKG